jgi:predicted DCC family thiol-disulfide oxidoreductase YuxK
MDTPSLDAPAPPAPHVNGARPDRALLDDHALLLFDGVCNLCNGFVNFLIDHDPEVRLKVAALQSEEAAPWLRAAGLDPSHLDSVVLIEKGRVTRKSTAALRVARLLGGPWALAYAFMAIPRPLRDAAYDLVARFRYDWFGKRDACRLPTPELRAHFL